MNCPSWWKIFWFTVFVMTIATLPHIGLQDRDQRIAFSILSIPFFAIIVTIVYVLKVIRPLRAVNEQLTKAVKQFERAITHNISWTKTASPKDDGSGAAEGVRRRRRKRGAVKNPASSVNVSFCALTSPDDERKGSEEGGGGEGEGEEGGAFDPKHLSASNRSASAAAAEGDGYSSVSGADDDGLESDDGVSMGDEAHPLAPEEESIVLTTRKAWEELAATSKSTSGLPEIRTLQKRTVALSDLYYALLLAHEVRLKGKGLFRDKASLLNPTELTILGNLKIDIEDKAAAQIALALSKDDGPAAPNSAGLNIPPQLKLAGVLSPHLEVPFFLARGKRFAGDNGMVVFYITRSSDSYVVGYSATVEALTPKGTAMGDLAVELLRHNMTPPPLLFDPSRSVEPLASHWYATGGTQFHTAGLGGGPGRYGSSSSASNSRSMAAVEEQHGNLSIVGGRDAPEPTPLNYFERRFWYGLRQSPLALCPCTVDDRVRGAPSPSEMVRGAEEAAVRNCTRVSVSLTALRGRTYTLMMARCHLADTFAGDNCRAPGGVWAPVLVGHVNSILCIVESAHVCTKPPQRFWQMPTTESIEIKGLSLENRGGSICLGSWVAERVELTKK